MNQVQCRQIRVGFQNGRESHSTRYRRLSIALVIFHGLLLCISDATAATVDPAIAGTWISENGSMTLTWVVTATGRYQFHGRGPDVWPPDNGAIEAMGGRWVCRSDGGAVTTGTYQLDGNVLRTAGPGGSAIWRKGIGTANAPQSPMPELPVTDTKEAARFEALARTAQQAGDDQEALSLLHRAVRLDRWNARLYNARGYVFRQLEEYEEAVKDYTMALRIDPSMQEAYYNRGVALNKLSGQIILRNDEQSDESKKALGIVSMAISDFSQALRLNKQDARSWSMRGLGFLKLLQFDSAMRDFSIAIRLDPQYAYAWGYLGIAKIDQWRDEEGMRDLQKCWSLNSKLRPEFEQHLRQAREFRVFRRDYQRSQAEWAAATEQMNQAINSYWSNPSSNASDERICRKCGSWTSSSGSSCNRCQGDPNETPWGTK